MNKRLRTTVYLEYCDFKDAVTHKEWSRVGGFIGMYIIIPCAIIFCTYLTLSKPQ